MSYNLWTQGVTDVDRILHLFNKKTVGRDPLSGIVDDVNQYFYTNYQPILSSGSVGVYTSGSSPIASTEYTIDYSAGLVTFNTAPSVQPSMTYQTARLSDYDMKSILVTGFDEMETMWFRGFALSETVGNAVVPITEDSPTAYITQSTGSDPQIGTIYFADSRAQIGLYIKCVQLAYIRNLMTETGYSHYLYAEAQGAKVDKSKTTANLAMAYDRLLKSIQDTLKAAQYEWYGDSVFGGAILSPHTKDFTAHNFWQKRSISEDWRSNTSYVGDRW